MRGTILRNDKFSVKVQNEPIDPQGNYLLSWDVDLEKGLVTFDVEAVTTGYVGFGISPNGGMAGADIFIAGVDDNGASYAFDMHGGAENGPPIPDTQSDWNLLEASEDETKTYLKFSRLLNTCDDEDYVISNDTVRIYLDDVAYHERNRAPQSLNLLMPDEADFNPEEYIKWDVMSEVTMPKADTTYWCSVHKGPELNATHHVISFEAVLDDAFALEHTHHFIIFKCVAPADQNADDLFRPFVNHPGENCYAPSDEQELPVNNCLQHYLFVWSKGGKRTVFPADVGYPIPDEVGVNNYYMMEVHYDNPQLEENRRFTTGARIMYTEKLRNIEAAMLTVAHQVHVTLTVPPNQTDYVVAECTYNNIWNKGKIVVGGISTREEMCMAFLWYYPKIDFEYCGSRYTTAQHFQELGIANYTRSSPEDGGI
ncbi:DBH-like monooxygenase protein 1 [Orchesella cincta]|uniref:DBH-like monooxygenase protein 1 n=1 Tax=Orchesella cincta TaxID=48709 RepID=A0A1D2MPY8_ORCCI|nr:DBH-like monooxygenase protein 1 [Orchesella cincta]